MKLLFLNQFFWPDTAATGQLLTDTASHLADRASVTVICAATRYGVVNQGPGPPVNIVRVPSFGTGRLAAYLSFLAGTVWQCLKRS